MNIWQERIHALIAKGMNQQSIAEQAGCSISMISLLASGKRKNVRYETGEGIMKVCKMLSIDIKE